MRRILLDEPVTLPVTRMTKISSTRGVRTLRARMTEGFVPVTEATGILRALLDAMEGGLANGGRLRTITPDAVVLEGDGRVSIADDAEPTRAGTTTEDAYRAPERSGGEGGRDHELAERSGVYSWGVIAYELFVGVVPFATADSPEALRLAHATESPVPIAPRGSGVRPHLARTVMLCLAKEPRERPTIALLRDTLDEVAGGTDQRPSGVWSSSWRATRMPMLALLLLVVLALAVLLGARVLRV